jgi:radical SAM protein (TIGR01212 family)
MTRNRGIKICTHIILGFPWENIEHWLKQATVLSTQPIDFLKIHHLHVVRDTVLAEQYIKHPFHVFAYHEYLKVIVSVLERLAPRIVIQRLAGETAPKILIAPRWDKKYAEVLHEIELELERQNTWQGKRFR